MSWRRILEACTWVRSKAPAPIIRTAGRIRAAFRAMDPRLSPPNRFAQEVIRTTLSSTLQLPAATFLTAGRGPDPRPTFKRLSLLARGTVGRRLAVARGRVVHPIGLAQQAFDGGAESGEHQRLDQGLVRPEQLGG